MNLLTATGLCVTRQGRRLLEDVGVTLAAGRLQVLLGANGAGKTTLLRVLAGEWQADAGEVRLGEQRLSQLSAESQARRRAVLPQQDLLAFGFTVRQLVTLGRHAAADQRPATTRSILAAVLEATDISHLAGRRYPELSGGERRRAQLARVLAQVWDQPTAVLLLDEPTHSLDLAHQHIVMALLRRLTARGFAVLASLHELNLAAAYADEVSLMREGRMLASGAAASVLQPPQLKAVYGQGLHFTAVGETHRPLWLTNPETD